MRRLILSAVFACAGVLSPACPVAAREAVLLVTDWSNSMNGRAEGALRRRELVPVIAESYFADLAGSASPPMVGLITFGNTGRSDSPQDEKVCERDVTLAVPADTDFRVAKEQVPAVIAQTTPSGFTPIFSAIGKAADVAGAMLDDGRATAVRIVLVTDLADVCDSSGGYRKLNADEYCALGSQVRKTVSAVDERHRGIVKFEFVVAVGENVRNIGQIAECADATSLAANTLDEARIVGRLMAQGHAVPLVQEPVQSSLQFRPYADGAGDAFGRGSGSLTMTLRIGTETLAITPESVVTRETGTTGTLQVQAQHGVDIGPLPVSFTGDGIVDIPWRLPTVTLAVQDAAAPAVPAIVLVRSIEAEREIQLDVRGQETLTLLPGDYQVVVGYGSGGWSARDLAVSRGTPAQTVTFSKAAQAVGAVWLGSLPDPLGLPGPLEAAVQGVQGQVQPLPFERPVQVATSFGAAGAEVELRRSGRIVWADRHATMPGVLADVTLRGGTVWVTAALAGPGDQSVWRLIDLTDGPTADPTDVTYFRGARFAQPLAPGTYRLSVDGSEFCGEGARFEVRIGRPVDFGRGPPWTAQGICE